TRCPTSASCSKGTRIHALCCFTEPWDGVHQGTPRCGRGDRRWHASLPSGRCAAEDRRLPSSLGRKPESCEQSQNLPAAMSIGSEAQKPLAVVIIGGLVTATVFICWCSPWCSAGSGRGRCAGSWSRRP